ncbi:MAG: 3-dehydroquinate synthase, partial [Nitriliruptoraceae bacterium]
GATRIDVELGTRSYPVLVGEGLRSEAAEVFASLAGAGRTRRALIVTQEPVVAAGHLDAIEDALDAAGIDHTRALVPDGEAAKDVEVLTRLWRSAATVPLTRQDLIVAVGGGVVGDLAGFVAATYARGIDVVQVPTTVLAQVDAAIGGKTGINLPEGKNLVGAFHQPRAVLCDVATLATLPLRVRREGFGEIVKCGLIRDASVLDSLEADPEVAGTGGARGAVGATAGLRSLVERSVAVKAAVVSSDERESGERAFLNFGHTFAHVVESLTDYTEVLHGEAVAIGMVLALRIGVRAGITDPALGDRAEDLLVALGLPVRAPALDREAIWSTMARDKKADGDEVRFVLLRGLGEPVVLAPSRSDVDAVLDEMVGPA